MTRSRTFYFDGSLATYVGTAILAALLTMLTLGIGFPWALVMKQRWRAQHTLVSGRRLRFAGTGGELFGLWLKWLGLTLVTLGIYLFWVFVDLERWVAEHTDFADGQPALLPEHAPYVRPHPAADSAPVALRASSASPLRGR